VGKSIGFLTEAQNIEEGGDNLILPDDVRFAESTRMTGRRSVVGKGSCYVVTEDGVEIRVGGDDSGDERAEYSGVCQHNNDNAADIRADAVEADADEIDREWAADGDELVTG
jgi:hypothetical protein